MVLMLSSLNMPAHLNMLADFGGNFWLPPQASTIAQPVDWLFYFVFYICVFFFLLILVLLVGFAWIYRYREGHEPGDAPKHNTALELTWTFIPTVIVVIIFVYGFKGFLQMNVQPPDPYEIVVQGQMWHYSFRYPNGWVDKDLHVPMNIPVKFLLNSSDVIHGFYIPVFRVKKDVVPGRYNSIWIDANVAGVYDVFCTQYCGLGHSEMRAKATVESVADYKHWLDNTIAGLPPDQLGQRYYQNYGCNQCHSVDGTAGRGPTWKDVYGSMVTLKDGKELVDENYLRYMIMVNPANGNAKQIPGFSPIMPSFVGTLNDRSTDALIAYIKSISVNYHPSLPTTTTAPSAAPMNAATQPSR